jgi:DNA-directed RNA polymerase specialized sigma24 family protein
MGRQIPVVIKDDAPSSRLVSAELLKGDVRKRLHAIASWHTRSDADAKDLVAGALVRVLEPEDRP